MSNLSQNEWKMKKYKEDPHQRCLNTPAIPTELNAETGVLPFSLVKEKESTLEFGISTEQITKDLGTSAMASIRSRGQPLDSYMRRSTFSSIEQRDLDALDDYRDYLMRTARLCEELVNRLEIIVKKRTLEYQDLTAMENLVRKMCFVCK